MFDIPAFTVDTYDEWRGVNRTTPVHLQAENRQPTDSRSRNTKATRDTPVAPPLAAYLADAPGPRTYHDPEQRSEKYASILTPEMSMKLDKLRLIRLTGYYTLAPIGVNKTMAQLDYEAQEMEDEDCDVGQAENLNANVSTTIYQDAPSGISEAAAGRDLDADIEDIDASGSFQDSSDLSDVDNGIDQQNLRRVNPLSGSLADTQVLSGGTGISITTDDTGDLSPPGPNCDASDVDMMIEDD